MMRRVTAIVVSCLVALHCAAVSVRAQGASQSLGIRAVVPKYCTIGGMIRPAEFTVRFVVDDDGRASASVAAFASTAAICNTIAEMTVVSVSGGGRSVAVAADNVGGLGYVARVAFGAARAGIVADGKSVVTGTAITQEATRDTLRVLVTPIDPAAKLVPGTVYLDTLRVTLLPL